VGKGTGTEVPANTSLYDAILAIPTTPELEANAALRYAALALLIAAIPTTPELEADALARYTTLSTRLTAARAGYLDLIPTLDSDITTIVDTRLTSARAGYLDYLNTILYAMLPNLRVEVALAPATENAAVSIAVTTPDQSLGSKDITVDIPTGATIESVIALARIQIMNNSATAQKIDLKLKVEGVTLFSQTDVIGFPAADGASATYTIAEDASDEVTTVGQVVTLEALETLSAAASVRFQAQYYLFIVYRMG